MWKTAWVRCFWKSDFGVAQAYFTIRSDQMSQKDRLRELVNQRTTKVRDVNP